MFAIFILEIDAKKYSDKVHNWLLNNCPKYCAIEWETPVKHPTLAQFYIQLPQEYEKEYYKTTTKIQDVCAAELSKASEVDDNLPPGWLTSISQI